MENPVRVDFMPIHRNLAAMHRHQAERLGPRPALRYRDRGLFHDLTWSDYRAEVLAGAAALVMLLIRKRHVAAIVAGEEPALAAA